MKMVNLTCKRVIVRTLEEYKKILKEAENQGFRWSLGENMNPLPDQTFPSILEFDKDKTVTRRVVKRKQIPLLEARGLFNVEEPTAREFIEYIKELRECAGRSCFKCATSPYNTKCGKYLCDVENWEGNEEELISIVKSKKIIIDK